MVSVSLYAAEASDRENVFSERFTLVGNQMKTVVVEALKSIYLSIDAPIKHHLK